MGGQLVKIKQVWTRQFKRTVYSCIIADLLGDPKPEIIGCSFSAEMKAFDLNGNEVFLTEFSSNITSFKIASISQERSIELVSGALDGVIYVMDLKGNPIWTTDLKDPIICMETGDLIGDNKEEIIIGLENQQLIGLDNEGNSFLEFMASEPIIDCTIGSFSNEFVGKILILLKSGKILNVDNEGNPELIYHAQNNPTSLGICNFFNQPLMIIGYKDGLLKIIDADKEIIGEYDLGAKISCVDNYTITSGGKKITLLVAASKNSITLLRLEKGKTKEIEEVSDIIEAEEQQPIINAPEEMKPESSQGDSIVAPVAESAKPDIESHPVRVLRGGQIEGGEYVFKIKVINNGKYNITDVNIYILSYPEESLVLSRIDSHPDSSPDRVKFHKISKGGGFVSPSFIFKPNKDCIKGTIHSFINFITEEDQIETINVEPHEIRLICGLLKPKVVSNEEFENLTKDLLTFKRNDEEFTIPCKAEELYQKLLGLLKSKNFAIVDEEKQESEGKFIGTVKGFAEGSFNKRAVGLKLTLTGNIDEEESVLKVDIFAEDEDMSPSIISEFESAMNPQCCPECEENLPIELARKLVKGLSIYCEVCGSKLLEVSGDIKAEKEES
ncbi:MAG: hypothetical protein ACW98D_06410 [Promethearchaeota archaeon]|jgi:hypothetical protein